MLTPWEFIADLTNPVLSFLPRALLVTVLAALGCAVVGSHVVVRGMAFVGDAVAHAVFPGIAVAFLVGGSLLVGGVVAAVTTAVLVAVVSHRRIVNEQAVIGVFFTAAFALGVLVVSRAPGYAGSLSSFLFGSLTGVSTSDVAVTAAGTALIVAVTLMMQGPLVAVTLEREWAAAAGVRVLAVDIGLYVIIACAVVLSVRTIGNILVMSLLITPAATARLLTHRLGPMMALAATLGCSAALIGIYLSWALDLPAGSTVVLVSSLGFVATWSVRSLAASSRLALTPPRAVR